jgi:hypothetical protein
VNKAIGKRIEFLDKSLPRSMAILDDETRQRWYERIVLAYHLGALKEDENPFDGLARALGYERSSELNDKDEVVKKYVDALETLYARAGLDYLSSRAAATEEAFDKMLEQVSEQWVKPIETAQTSDELFGLWHSAMQSRRRARSESRANLKRKRAKRRWQPRA